MGSSLAKNAGTSVNQIERFYAKRLQISGELMEDCHFDGEACSKDQKSQRSIRDGAKDSASLP